jgi:hypothetical protein
MPGRQIAGEKPATHNKKEALALPLGSKKKNL